MLAGDAVYEFRETWEARVINRPNRFTVETDSGPCHLHDPGRLLDLIYPGNKVLVRRSAGGATKCRVTAAWSWDSGEWVVVDSGIHSDIASQFLPSGSRREVRVGRHRLDFAFDDAYVEVKGCTLAVGGRALFPDAPTRRGADHMALLARLRGEGWRGIAFILVMRSANCFAPNWGMDPRFSAAFREAVDSGVEVWVKRFGLRGSELVYWGDIDLCPDWRREHNVY